LSEPKTLFISGTSRGVGRGLVDHYCARGHTVFGCSRSDVDFRNDNYHHTIADVVDEDAVRQIFAKAKSLNKKIDVLVNNAGLSQQNLVLMTSTSEAQNILRNNVLSSFVLIREAISYMKRQKKGRIINFLSINAPLNSIGSALYNASKAAVENLAGTVAWETADDDITINNIGLSLVAGPGMRAELSDAALNKKRAGLIKKSAINISEIAHTIDFLSSDNAANITNQTIYFGGIR